MKMNKKANSPFDFVIRTNILPKSKRSQVTIFIILGLILVVVIALLFLLIKKPDVGLADEENPQAYIESCTNDAVEEAVEILLKNGGDLEPKGSVMYNGKELTYLCYNKNYYKPCINQRPMLIEHIENEITSYIQPRVSNCFQTLRTELEPRYNVEMDSMELTTELQTKQVVIDIKRDFKITRGDDVRSFTEFKVNLINPIYDLAKIAMEISNQEAHYCNFDILGFMIIYPKYDIQKFKTGDSDTIYTLKDLSTNQEFKFAIRSCVLPAGF